MSERFKYSLNGVYRCENIAQHLAANNFPIERIGSAGGFNNWYIKLKTNPTNEKLVYPFVISAFNKRLSVKFFFCALKRDESTAFPRSRSAYLKMTEGPRGENMHILELLYQNNEYLDNEALVIEYGFQVESGLGMDNIWRFNTIDPLFNCQGKKNMITFPRSENHSFHVHKQLFTFHSSYFNERCRKDKGNFVEQNDSFVKHYGLFEALGSFLQIANGVQLKLLSPDHIWIPSDVMNIARIYSMWNVIRYCERQMIENDLRLRYLKDWVIHWDGLRHYLVHVLKNVKCPKEMIDEDDLKKMKGETMKLLVAKFLYNKF